MKDLLRGHGNAVRRLLLGGIAATALISCGDDQSPGPTDGTIEITTNTEGVDFDQDGYLWSVNNSQGQPIGHQATVWVDALEAGDYEVELSGIADNCTVPTDANPQDATVVPGDTTEVLFQVTCEVPEDPDGGGGGPQP